MTFNPRLKEMLTDITDEIVNGYEEVGTIHHLGHCALPAFESVVEIAQDLKEIIFPGFRRRQNLTMRNVRYHIGDLLDELHDKIAHQVSRALKHEYELRLRVVTADQPEETDFDADAQKRTLQFLNQIAAIRRTLLLDVKAAYENDPAAKSTDAIVLCYPGLEAITVHRVAHELHRLKIPFLPRMLSEWAHMQTGIDIHPGAQIGPSFFIDHGTGVVIGETCEIGSHVTLYQGVTLGARTFPRDLAGNLIRNQKRHPTLQDNVVVYSNATVLGGKTTIGTNSRIGANVSINRSVPPNTLVTNEKPSLRFREAG